MSIKFGIRFNSDSGTIAEILKLAKVAEQSGFEYVWYCQDLFKRDAWIALTAIAAVTKQIKLGTALVNPFTAHPVELAMRAATLQELTGRAVLGIGAGDLTALEWMGLKPLYPLTETKEAVLHLRTLLKNEQTRAKTDKVFNKWTEQAYLRFRVEKPIPIYIGGQRPKMLELMGELGDGALPLLFPPGYATEVVRHIMRGVKRANRQTEDLDIAGCVWYWLGEEGNNDRPLRHLIAYYGPLLADEMLKHAGLKHSDFTLIQQCTERGDYARARELVTNEMRALAITGDEEQIIRQIESLAKAGITHLNIGPPLGPTPREAIERTERIIAYFKSEQPC